MASLEPSRRRTDAVASIRPSIGMRSGSLWPPTKLYLGKPGKRGAGSGNPFAKCDVRSNAALMIFPSVGLWRRFAWWTGGGKEGPFVWSERNFPSLALDHLRDHLPA